MANARSPLPVRDERPGEEFLFGRTLCARVVGRYIEARYPSPPHFSVVQLTRFYVFVPNGIFFEAKYRGITMQLSILALLAASAAVLADTDSHGQEGWGSHSQTFVPSFDNLVTFGDR